MRHRSRYAERGTALIEFALVLPFMLTLTFAVVDMSRAFWVKNTVHQAAREGVRYLVVHTAADSGAVRDRVTEVLGAANLSLKTLSINGPLPGPRYEVQVGASFTWLFPGLFKWLGGSFQNPMTIQATCVMRKEG
jgi:Flp pilus assembly protein TadG